ncbi:MAG: NifU family protein, partial [Thermoguttaceae bacterium]|nr:NifU family protein [Thermoguttaceae bacterium]
ATVTTAKDGTVKQNPTLTPISSPVASAEEFSKASAYQKAKLIEKTIDAEIRPVLQRDGGDLEIVDVKDNLVYVQLVGACDGCESATQTLELLVETALQDRLDPTIKVIQL